MQLICIDLVDAHVGTVSPDTPTGMVLDRFQAILVKI